MCKVYKVNNRLGTFEKPTTNKKYMVYITCLTLQEGNIHSVFLLNLFVGICLRCSFSFLANFLTVYFFEKALAIVTKCSVLDVAGILNPPQYVPT